MKTKTLAAGLALAFSIAGADTRTATVQGGGPVAKAIELLEKFYGVPITYEDPPYVNSVEITDVTEKVRGGQSSVESRRQAYRRARQRMKMLKRVVARNRSKPIMPTIPLRPPTVP